MIHTATEEFQLLEELSEEEIRWEIDDLISYIDETRKKLEDVCMKRVARLVKRTDYLLDKKRYERKDSYLNICCCEELEKMARKRIKGHPPRHWFYVKINLNEMKNDLEICKRELIKRNEKRIGGQDISMRLAYIGWI